MKNYNVKSNQTLFDVALECYGNAQGVYWLVADNKLNGITDTINAGQVLLVRDVANNPRVANELQVRQVATATTDSLGTGIGWWQIDNDFEVQ